MFYDRYLQLCSQRGVSPSRAAFDVGLTRASVMKWKNGSLPGARSLALLAGYFGVSADDLLGEGEEKPGEDRLAAFYNRVKADLTEEDIDDLITYMRLRADLHRAKKKGFK